MARQSGGSGGIPARRDERLAGAAGGGIHRDLLQRAILRMIDPELRRMATTLPIEVIRMYMRQRDGRLVLMRALAVYMQLVEPGSPGVARMIQTDMRLARLRPRRCRTLALRPLRTAVEAALAASETAASDDQ